MAFPNQNILMAFISCGIAFSLFLNAGLAYPKCLHNLSEITGGNSLKFELQ